MGKAEGREKEDEAGRPGGDPPGGLSLDPPGEGVGFPASGMSSDTPSDSLSIVKRKSVWREYAEALLLAAALALFIRTFVVQAFKIPSGSMIPTLTIGDHILVNKFVYGVKIPFTDAFLFSWEDPQRKDVIVFKYPDDEKKDFIKRVVGIPGDRIEIADKQVSVNGTFVNEPYIVHQDSSIFPKGVQPRDNFGPIVVPEGSYFVMGDNRDQSLDSRFWGFVNRNKIKGKAFLIYWSWDGKGRWIRWWRIGKLVK